MFKACMQVYTYVSTLSCHYVSIRHLSTVLSKIHSKIFYLHVLCKYLSQVQETYHSMRQNHIFLDEVEDKMAQIKD